MEVRDKADEFRKVFADAKAGIEKVIVGQEHLIEELLICVFSGGHALLEGAPGIGKTLMAKTLSRSFGLKLSRIQFTPDLMPSDVIGTNFVVETADGKQFRFEKGPIFCQILLADEINRATPKTQSALLEAMQEFGVTTGGVHYPLKKPFVVLATQNPIEMEGTYPLPEAQLDRFFFKLSVSSPGQADLMQIIDHIDDSEESSATNIVGAEKVAELEPLIRGVPMALDVRNYISRLVLATHPNNCSAAKLVQKYVRYGASPRGALAVALAAKARALLSGRYNVSFEDAKSVVFPALRHRLILNFEGQAADISADCILKEILDRVPTHEVRKSRVVSHQLHQT